MRYLFPKQENLILILILKLVYKITFKYLQVIVRTNIKIPHMTAICRWIKIFISWTRWRDGRTIVLLFKYPKSSWPCGMLGRRPEKTCRGHTRSLSAALSALILKLTAYVKVDSITTDRLKASIILVLKEYHFYNLVTTLPWPPKIQGN